ncbi:MAG: hypothetical protein HYV06_05850 [Deltaproteobacteria bacterium]|nr:hypothetical protein [Deltaproteobacteria bacterium]
MMLVEEFNSELKLVHECISALDRKIDDVEERLTEKIEHVDFKVDVLNKKIDDVEARLGARIDRVAVDLDAHRSSTELHQTAHKRPLKRV